MALAQFKLLDQWGQTSQTSSLEREHTQRFGERVLEQAMWLTRFNSTFMSTENFQEGLRDLKRVVETGGGVAMMCSETLWWRYHRRMIAIMLVAEWWEVRHLGVKKGEAMPHVLWDIARIRDDESFVYDSRALSGRVFGD